jgi:hypothetical protein
MGWWSLVGRNTEFEFTCVSASLMVRIGAAATHYERWFRPWLQFLVFVSAPEPVICVRVGNPIIILATVSVFLATFFFQGGRFGFISDLNQFGIIIEFV